MKTGYGGCLVAVLLLTIPLTGAGVWEFLQRRRFAVVEREVQDLITEYEMSVHWTADDEGRPVFHPYPNPNEPDLMLRAIHWDSFQERKTGCLVPAQLSSMAPPWLRVVVEQRRNAFLGSPIIRINSADTTPTNVPDDLAARFGVRGLTYTTEYREWP